MNEHKHPDASSALRTIERQATALCPASTDQLRSSLANSLTGMLKTTSETQYLHDLCSDSCSDSTGFRIRQWTNALNELLMRLNADWSELVERFALDPGSRLSGVSAPLGDLHNHGRSVYKIRFTDARVLVYKPRSVETEHIFGRFLDGLHQEGCPATFSHFVAVSKSGYGWADFVRSTPCATPEQAHAYYRRQGAFLAIFWLLCAGDAIGDNMIVVGDHPVWVDLECTCVPALAPLLVTRAAMPGWISDSIVTTAMVFRGTATPDASRRYTGLDVSCMPDRSAIFTSAGVLKTSYQREVVEGFRETYRWMLDAANTSASARDGLLSMWHDVGVRVVLRPTRVYSYIQRWLEESPQMKRTDAEAQIDTALRSGTPVEPTPAGWPDDIVRLEREALLRGDIPYWQSSTTARSLREAGSSEIVSGVVAHTGMERVGNRAARMSEADLQRQVWLLESFLAR